jgi:hypothetical protein
MDRPTRSCRGVALARLDGGALGPFLPSLNVYRKWGVDSLAASNPRRRLGLGRASKPCKVSFIVESLHFGLRPAGAAATHAED